MSADSPNVASSSIIGIKGKRVDYRIVRGNKKFQDTLRAAKQQIPEDSRWRVDVHDANDYKGDTKIIADKGNGTVAVTPDGDIISLASTRKGDVRGSDLLKIAVQNGGIKLDSFDGNFNYYVKNGFTPVSWTRFDETYKPEGWNSQQHARESVVFFKYTGNSTKKISPEEFYNKVAPSKDYETAQKLRDSNL